MKDFLNKLKNMLSFRKKKMSEDDVFDDMEEFEDDGDTDPNYNLAGKVQIHDDNNDDHEVTQPEVTFPDIIQDEVRRIPDVIEEDEHFTDDHEELEISFDEEDTLEEDQTPLQDSPKTFTKTLKDNPKLKFQKLAPAPSLNEDESEDSDEQGDEDSDQHFDDLEEFEDDDEFDITKPQQPNLVAKLKGLFSKKNKNHIAPHLEQEDEDSDELDITKPQQANLVSKIKGIFNKKRKAQDDDEIFFEDVQGSKPAKGERNDKLSGINFFTWLFSNHSRPTVHRYFLLLIFLLLFFTIGKILGLILIGNKLPQIASPAASSAKNLRLTRQSFTALGQQDIFRANPLNIITKEKPVEKIKKDEVCLNADKERSFPYFLLNTIVLQDRKKSVASIQVKSNKKLLELREGMDIPDSGETRARVDRIGRLRVIIKNYNTGTCEYIANTKGNQMTPPINILSESVAKNREQKLEDIQGIQNEGNSIVIKRDFLNEQMKDISSLLSQALAIPINNPDGTVSFRVTEIEPGSIFSYLNIQNGDLITQINGKEISSQNEVLNLFAKLKTVSKLKLTVNRGGSDQELDYAFK